MSQNPPAERLAKRLEGVSESATLKLNATVQAMKAQGLPVVNLTAGEPDFAVPAEGKRAAIAAIEADKSKYTPASGIAELRERIAARTNGQQPAVSPPWKASDVIVTNGGKQAIFNALMALVDPGDEVLIPAPYWLSYPEMAKLCGGVPRILPTRFEDGFKLKPTDLEAALTERSRILFVNSPSNPTGAMYSQAELKALGDVLLKHPRGGRVWVISDEIYDLITFGEPPFCSFLQAAPALRSRTVTVNGMSKSAAMTGWRVGWSVAPANVTAAMSTLQGQSTSGINSVAQWASVAALDLPPGSFTQQVDSYRRRRDLVLEILARDPTIKVVAPQGAFYIFAGVEAHFHDGEDSIAFAQRLLEQAQVAVVPGTPFGAPGFLRLSFATEEGALREGCRRLVEYLATGARRE